jgi:hypothetical protein
MRAKYFVYLLAVIAAAFSLSRCAQGQGAGPKTPPAKQKYQEFPAGVEDCSVDPANRHDYCVNVVSLRTNTTEMSWKQSDTFRVEVFNNPFIYSYKLEVNETAIAEDDVLAKLGPLLGLSTPSTPKTSAKTTGSTPSAAAKPSGPLDAVINPGIFNPKATCRLVDLESADKNAKQALLMLAVLQKDLGEGLAGKKSVYLNFKNGLNEDLNYLRDERSPIPDVKSRAVSLQTRTLATYDTLVKDFSFELKFVEYARTAADVYRQVGEAQKCDPPTIQELSKDPKKKPTKEQVANYQEEKLVKQQVNDELASLGKLTGLIEENAADVSFTLCVYLHYKQGEFSSLRTSVLEPLNQVFANPDAFHSAQRDLGPYVAPTEADISLTRTPISDGIGTNVDQAENTVFQCDCGPDKLLKPGPFTAANLAALSCDTPAKESCCDKAQAQQPAKKDSQSAPAKTVAKNPALPATALRLNQPLLFGGPRFVVAGGLTPALLPKYEFQRSFGQPLDVQGKPVAGAQPAAVIGYKTNSSLRLSPMLFAHTRIAMLPRWRSEAFFATLGVTANSDNQGTAPEFFVGGSVSLAQSKFFLSAGAYLGQQQHLDGGLYVGQAIPSSLTGELPVTKSYRTGFAFSLSYRFASTADPKKDTANNASSPAKSTQKSAKTTN